MKFSTLLDYYKCNPHDVHTVPTTGARPLWFHVYLEGDDLYVGPAKEKKPSCALSYPRLMEGYKCEVMFDLYNRRKRGWEVSCEASLTSKNSSYWYGIFNDVEKKL